MDIDELLTAIDTWRAALDDYINTDAGLNPVFAAAKPLTGNEGTQDTLYTMTTLADEIRRLREQLAIETARSISFEKRITELETFGDATMLVEHAQMKARIEEAMRIEPPTVDGILINRDYALGHHAALSKVRNALGLRGE